MKTSTNPFNGENLFEFQELNDSGLRERIARAQSAFLEWKTTSFGERAKLMRTAGRVLMENSEKYAEIITLEMGKPIVQSIAEIEKCAWVCEYYATHAENHLKDEIIKTEAEESFVRYEPLGPVLAIMPWNYPFWQVFRFAAPNLMAGNVGLLKHASNVMKSAETIQQIFEKAGFLKGCFQNLVISNDQVKTVIGNSAVKAVTLTGSTPVGASVAATAGYHIKKTVLELGGNNALVVFDDAQLERTLDICIQARFQNTGQSCIAGKRLLVQSGIAPRFIHGFRNRVAKLKSGDPMDKDTFVGVLAREDLAIELEKQMKRSIKMGAKVILGGKRNGTYFEPTILLDVTRNMPVFKEETFGPVLGITIFDTEEEAIGLANDSEFGLGISLFTSDRNRIQRLIPKCNEGAVFVNELVKSDPRLPFGGIKTSGYGRELSAHGIREFMNRKTVYIKS
ncbi:NAD-dependent succinate-semialdehyde dehydrogenase [Ulvibacterium sp.]|uniref:NAD-dependent succinate-semialdehyde dehydrogenase n=1 Tax=Ulvibacterium sp. TaxID=2665914 RepID=UPI0026380565|nr:NAD-dependent succinate-semialdehyde dehydrogenase [Ulvibacterium sp.]